MQGHRLLTKGTVFRKADLHIHTPASKCFSTAEKDITARDIIEEAAKKGLEVIGNVDTKWGELNSVVMKGKDAKSSRMRRVMYEGNVLVSTTRPTRNAIAIVSTELDKQICSTGFAVLKCKPTMNNRFLFYALRTWLSNLQFAKHCSGSGYPAINQETDLPHIRVPVLLAIDDQAKIASEVDDLTSKAREIEGESKNKQQIAETVFDKAIIQAIPLLEGAN